ncbi:MAG: bifunctional UDP-N-acetylglucosamine diphosphorylase/glucosamine-1-phosphate N-acetyltransferase GlmU [Armatimonadetes bacterium]|nr:bifunctional UDP-N-acetylglucosamine diphosphorylase/glucosamine-1-phosphate N-acetyltransferase GlmU [Armatimonadota bacterium]
MQSQSSLAGVILAAGKGTRMKSDLPKCLHTVCGLPMAELVGRAMHEIGIAKPVVVVGHKGESLQAALDTDRYDFAWQNEQLGTAHATMMAAPMLDGKSGSVVVSPGDVPLLSAEALRELVTKHHDSGAKATIGTCILNDPSGYGRIIRDSDGKVCGIVEHRDASPEERKISEINSAVYCFDSETLLRLLPTIEPNNDQGEFYLPDVIKKIYDEGGLVETLVYDDFFVFQGVNDPWQLAMAGKELRTRILKHHALLGTLIVDPDTTYIGADVKIGSQTVIHPMTTLEGTTVIGSNCHIGPLSVLVSSVVGDGSTVLMSHVNRGEIGEDCRVGPYSHIRPKSKIGNHCKIGNFVELKNAALGDSVAAGHLAYVGDAVVGSGTNVGAGTITCNYDGVDKHMTHIGENVFVGSNSTLVAPVAIGDGAYVGAGSVITNSVAADALALGRARQVEKPEWASRRRKKRQQSGS